MSGLLTLDTFPYPWDDRSVAEIETEHVLEHLGQHTQTELKIIQELYRICQGINSRLAGKRQSLDAIGALPSCT